MENKECRKDNKKRGGPNYNLTLLDSLLLHRSAKGKDMDRILKNAIRLHQPERIVPFLETSVFSHTSKFPRKSRSTIFHKSHIYIYPTIQNVDVPIYFIICSSITFLRQLMDRWVPYENCFEYSTRPHVKVKCRSVLTTEGTRLRLKI